MDRSITVEVTILPAWCRWTQIYFVNDVTLDKFLKLYVRWTWETRQLLASILRDLDSTTQVVVPSSWTLGSQRQNSLGATAIAVFTALSVSFIRRLYCISVFMNFSLNHSVKNIKKKICWINKMWRRFNETSTLTCDGVPHADMIIAKTYAFRRIFLLCVMTKS